MFDLRSFSASSRSFVTEVEVWLALEPQLFERMRLDASGVRSDRVNLRDGARNLHRLALRTAGSQRVELEVAPLPQGGDSVALALPGIRARHLDSIVILRCTSAVSRGGCIEVWEPSGSDDLAHAEGYYGALVEFELSSRLSRFRSGIGLPGIAWERRRPHLIADVRTAPAFRRAELAKTHGLALGVGIPIVHGSDVRQVVTLLSAESFPVASAVELWVPDRSQRLWLDASVYVSELAKLATQMKTTCFMRGEGVVGRAFESGRPLVWSRHQRDARMVDAESFRMNLGSVTAIPIVSDDVPTAVLVLRS